MKRKRTKHNSVLPLVLSVVMCTSTMMATHVVSTSDAFAASASSVVSQSARGAIIQFKDENLKNSILFIMKAQHLIDQSAVDITEDDALKAKELNLNYGSIKSIEGLEKFKNLTNLYLEINQISDLTPLTSLTKLTNLDLDSNKISDITPLANLTKLTTLNLSNNQISDLTPLTSLTKLTNLYLESNQISNLTPLANLTILTHTNATEQTITLRPTSIKVDLAKEIKGFGTVTFNSDENIVNGVLTHKGGMQNPYIVNAQDGDSYSATIKIDFSQAVPHVIHFKDENLKNRVLSEMKEKGLIEQSAEYITEDDALKAKELSLDSSSINSIEGLEKFKSLTNLDLGFNQISDLTPLTSLTNLTELALRKNQISDIAPLTNLSKLTNLYLNSNKIFELTPLTNLTKLTNLMLGYNQISNITALTSLTNLTELDLRHNQISDIKPLKNLTKLTELDLDKNQISNITALTSLTNLTELALRNNRISDITPLASLTSLTNLFLDGNRISDITPLVSLTNRIQINAQDQTITIYPKTIKVDLAKEIKGAGNVIFGSDENIVNGVLTYKNEMQNPYSVNAEDGRDYSATINIDFSQIIHKGDTPGGGSTPGGTPGGGSIPSLNPDVTPGDTPGGGSTSGSGSTSDGGGTPGDANAPDEHTSDNTDNGNNAGNLNDAANATNETAHPSTNDAASSPLPANDANGTSANAEAGSTTAQRHARRTRTARYNAGVDANYAQASSVHENAGGAGGATAATNPTSTQSDTTAPNATNSAGSTSQGISANTSNEKNANATASQTKHTADEKSGKKTDANKAGSVDVLPGAGGVGILVVIGAAIGAFSARMKKPGKPKPGASGK